MRRARPAFVELETRDLPTFYGNQVFPLDSAWNQKITHAPVSANSAAIMDYLVNTRGNARLHPDFGNPATDGELYGIPINVADSSTPKVPVLIGGDWGNESDTALVPIPANAVIEGDDAAGPGPTQGRGDSHLLVFDKSANILYEAFAAVRPTEDYFPSYDESENGEPHALGNWGAYNLSVWDLNTNSFRTLGFTSADAAGLPIMPGLVRPDETLNAGVIDHAIRFTVSRTRNEYVYPASHQASSQTATNLPRMGERFRLKAEFVIPPTWPAATRAVAQAMKDYGLIVADNGSDMYFQGEPSSQWNMDNMLLLQSAIRADDFEVVDLTPVVTGLSASTGNIAGGSIVTITGQNFTGAGGNLHVFFGNVEATGYTIDSDTQITAMTPAHAEGTVDVRVQSGSNREDADGDTVFFGYGSSANTAADDFTFNTTSPPPPVGPPPPPLNPPPPLGPPPVVPPTVPPVVPPTVPPTSPPPPVTPPTVPPPPPGPEDAPFAVGSGDGGEARILFANGYTPLVVTAFPGFSGAVRTALGDFTGDGVPDLVVGTGPGIATAVRILDGKDQHEVFAFAPFESSFTGGVYVAAGDVTGDGRPELVVSPDEGGGPRVRVLDGVAFNVIADFLGIDDANFRGGARVAVGDLDGDDVSDLFVAAGFGGGPRVAGFNGRSLLTGPTRLFADFLAFEPSLRNGTFIAAGDIDGDGRAELVAGGGPGGAPRVTVFTGRDLPGNVQTRAADFFAGDVNNRGGVRVGVRDLNGDGRADLIAGDSGSSLVTCYTGVSLTGAPEPWQQLIAFPDTAAGVFVG